MKHAFPASFLLFAFFSIGCQDVPSLADKNATIVLAADKTFLRLGGDIAQITIMGFSGGFEALRDGTLVTLTATLGTITPSVELRNGQALATFVSGSTRGQAKITARSGAAVGEITLDIEYSAQTRITIKSSPTSLPASGGRSEIRVEVTDGQGNPFYNIPVTLGTTSGSFEKGQNPLYTDAKGIVVDHLRTDASADITASALGQSATLRLEVAANVPPTATLTFWPTNPKIGEKVSIDGTASSDADGRIAQYVWTFSDGYKASSAVVKRTFSRSGDYVANLRVVDDLGASSATVSETITVVANQPPVASFTYSPTSPTTSAAVMFDGSGSSDPDGSITKWAWDLGEGVTATGEIVSHLYPRAGTYQILLTVSDNDGEVDTSGQTIVLTATPASGNKREVNGMVIE